MDCAECEAVVERLRRSRGCDARVAELLTALGDTPERPVRIDCRRCGDVGVERSARAFVLAPPISVVLCQNRLRGPHELQEALLHELVHVYDLQVGGANFGDVEQLAISEVRAAREAECAGTGGRTHLNSWMEKRCVRNCATRATSNIFPHDEASRAVEKHFEAAYADIHPFEAGDRPPATLADRIAAGLHWINARLRPSK